MIKWLYMTAYNSYRFGPAETPALIRKLLIWTAAVSLIVSLINPFFERFGFFGPETWLSLSWWGMERYLLFQPVTALFMQTTGYSGITMGWIMALGVNLYILWVFGSSVLEWIGNRSFLRLYFGSGVFAGLLALLFMPLLGQWAAISGATAATLSLLLVWSMMHPEAEIFVFLILPVKAKWIFAGLFGIFTIMALSRGSFVYLIYLFSGVVFGYFYALLAWNFRSPYVWMQQWDKVFIQWKNRFLPKEKMQIFSFGSGKKLDDDDAFVDAMLKKISKNGEKSLTKKERDRLDNISAQRRSS